MFNNDIKIEQQDNYYNIFFQQEFIVNLTQEELETFPWATFLPIDSLPNLSNFELV